MTFIKHFVITRIGIGIYNTDRLNKMISLFEAVTLNSIFNQNEKNFYHLIIFDLNIPESSISFLQKLIKDKKIIF